MLSSNKPFEHFKLSLSAEVKEEYKKMEIKLSASISIYGEFSSLLSTLNDWFSKNTGCNYTSRQLISQSIFEIIHEILKLFSAESARVDLRLTQTAHNIFDIPRWHIDGDYLGDGSTQKKIVLALKGPGTLFYKADENDRAVLKTHQEDRMKLAGLLQDKEKIESTPPDHATVFVSNSNSLGGVHSEPPITCPRFFIAVVPLTKTQVSEVKKVDKRNEQTFSTLFHLFFNSAQKNGRKDPLSDAGKCMGVVAEYLIPKV